MPSSHAFHGRTLSQPCHKASTDAVDCDGVHRSMQLACPSHVPCRGGKRQLRRGETCATGLLLPKHTMLSAYDSS
eukprot:scaffold39422_cov37-Tisochrysis_lutea.AAC.2